MKEPECKEMLRTMESGNTAIGTATLMETAILLYARLQFDARSLLSRILSEASVAVVPFGESHCSAAMDAWLR